MRTKEIIEFLRTHDFTDEQAYNLLVADLFDFIPESEVANAQGLVAYFQYKITQALSPVIRELKRTSA